MRDEVLKAAAEADVKGVRWVGTTFPTESSLERFYDLAYNAGLEAAAVRLEAQDVDPAFKNRLAAAIREMKHG